MDEPQHELNLRDRLRELSQATRDAQPSPEMEARLLRAFADSGRVPARSVPVRWVPAIAASLLLAAVVGVLVFQLTKLPARAPVAAAGEADGRIVSLDGFVPIPGAGALPQLESASIVRYELPVGALPALRSRHRPGRAAAGD